MLVSYWRFEDELHEAVDLIRNETLTFNKVTGKSKRSASIQYSVGSHVILRHSNPLTYPINVVETEFHFAAGFLGQWNYCSNLIVIYIEIFLDR